MVSDLTGALFLSVCLGVDVMWWHKSLCRGAKTARVACFRITIDCHLVIVSFSSPPPPPSQIEIESHLSGMKILLKQEGNDLPIATMEVGETFTPNKPLETLKCYGTSQLEHPGEFGEGRHMGPDA